MSEQNQADPAMEAAREILDIEEQKGYSLADTELADIIRKYCNSYAMQAKREAEILRLVEAAIEDGNAETPEHVRTAISNHHYMLKKWAGHDNERLVELVDGPLKGKVEKTARFIPPGRFSSLGYDGVWYEYEESNDGIARYTGAHQKGSIPYQNNP